MLPEGLPDVLTVRELSDTLRIGRRQAYDLAHRDDFPCVRVGRSFRIPRRGFERWLQENAGYMEWPAQ